MADETFTITYSGPTVAGGRMSVRELAPALLALSDTIRQAQRVAYPGEPDPALEIKALREGSFAIDLILSDAEGLLQNAIDLLSGREATAAANLGALVAMVFGGFRLTKALATRKIRRQERIRNGVVRVTFDDGVTMTLRQESLRLAADRPFREAARHVVAPLAAEGVESVELSSPREENVQIEQRDLVGFEIPPVEEQELVDEERTVVLRPVNVAFAEGNKWRVSDGESTFFATVDDLGFLHRVETAQEVFAKTDILRARVRTRQWRTADGDLRTDHHIVEVLEHVPGPRQIPLPFASCEEPPPAIGESSDS